VSYGGVTRTVVQVSSVADCAVPARRECFCNYQFNVKACSVQGIYKTSDVVKNDPSSLACKPGTVDVMSETFHPIFS